MNGAAFLPMSAAEMRSLGWKELDLLCVTGDAYVDHPSFGTAIIARLIESMGFRVGVIAQPDRRSTDDFAVMGPPRLAAFVAAGNMDSMLSNYSSRGKRRRRDAYSPNGEPGRRPDRATIVYCNRLRELWKGLPIIIGGIEASLRRLAHYDYWEDAVRRSILVDSKADLLVYGMAELQTREIVRRLAAGEDIRSITDVPGTCFKTHDPGDAIMLPSHEDVLADKRLYADSFRIAYEQQNFHSGKPLAQDQGAWHVVVNPPARPLVQSEMDEIYDLPYSRLPHPCYEGTEIPASLEIKFSITSHRGCFGECAFCAISSHQGRVIQSRSKASIVREAEIISRMSDFKGYIHDVGGPTANFRIPSCAKSSKLGACKGRSCLFPEPCQELNADHSEYIDILEAVSRVKGVKKVFIRSGIRHDYVMAAKDGARFLRALCEHHVSGQLKIAPEHVNVSVLCAMRKSEADVARRFIRAFRETNEELGSRQFLIPYFMSSHPGCGLKEALELAEFIRDIGIRPDQVQEFTPTPGSLSTCVYHTGIDPFSGREVYVAKSARERAMQRALMQYWKPESRRLVEEALKILGRDDLIGEGRRCLIRRRSKRWTA